MDTINALDSLSSTQCCVIVFDDFDSDTADQYEFYGLNATDHGTVAGGVMTLPRGCRARHKGCIGKLKSVNLYLSSGVDHDRTVNAFFWCNDRLSEGYMIRVRSNIGAGGDLSRKACLLELCKADGQVIKSAAGGALNPLHVEAWADPDSGNAYITINNSFSWKIDKTAALSEDGYCGFGNDDSSNEDIEVGAYYVTVVGTTDYGQGCIGDCPHLTPSNGCTHTATCNGGSLEQDYYPTLSSLGKCYESATDYTDDGDGWAPQRSYPCGCPKMDRWRTENTSATLSITGGGGVDACGDQPFRFCDGFAFGSDYDATTIRRFVRIDHCENTIRFRINMHKSTTASIVAGISLIPYCGTNYSDGLSAAWPATVAAPPLVCSSDENDEIENEVHNVPVGIYIIEFNASPFDTSFAGSPFSITLTVVGVESYERNCGEAQELREERNDLRDERAELEATNVDGVNDDAISAIDGAINDITDQIITLGGSN